MSAAPQPLDGAGTSGARRVVSALEASEVDAARSRPVHGIERVMLRFGETMGADLIIGRVAGAVDVGAFRAAADAVVRRYAMLRVRVEAGPPARFVAAEADGASAHVEVVEGADPEAWRRAAVRETTRPFALDGGAACRFILVVGPSPGEAHALVSAPHAIVDGRSLMRLLHDLLVAWGCAARGEEAAFERLPITPAAYTLVRRPFVYRVAEPLLRYAWMSSVRAHQSRCPLPPRAPTALAEDVATLAAFREGTPEGWARLSAACKRHEVTVGGALLAATWFALSRLVHDERGAAPDRLTMDVDVDLRARVEPPAPDTHVGFYTGVTEVGGRIAPSTDFWTIARRLRGQTARNLRWGLPELVHLMPEDVPDYFEYVEARGVSRHGAGGTGSLVSVSNVGRFLYPSAQGPLRLTGLWGMNGACLLGPTFIPWLRFVDGRMFYNSVGAAPAVDQAQLERFQDAIFELLEHPPTARSVASFCAGGSTHASR